MISAFCAHRKVLRRFTWLIVFTSEYVMGHPSIYVDGGSLTGIGSGVSTSLVQGAGRMAVLFSPGRRSCHLRLAHGSSMKGVSASAGTVSQRRS